MAKEEQNSEYYSANRQPNALFFTITVPALYSYVAADHPTGFTLQPEDHTPRSVFPLSAINWLVKIFILCLLILNASLLFFL